MTTKLKYIAIIALMAFSNCKDKKKIKPTQPVPDSNEQEIITSVLLNFTDTANVVSTFAFRDLDGAGGNAPVTFDTIKLNSSRTYSLEVLFLDETKSPVDTISKEVWEERDDHQLFFTHNGTDITTTYLDLDNKGYPVGLTTKWQTSNPANGTVKVVLKHQPDIKSNSETTGETDVSVEFEVKVN